MSNETFTLDMLNEAMAIINALAPKEAPPDCFHIIGNTGLNIVKNNLLPENTIVVSKRLFDLLHESSVAVNFKSQGE